MINGKMDNIIDGAAVTYSGAVIALTVHELNELLTSASLISAIALTCTRIYYHIRNKK